MKKLLMASAAVVALTGEVRRVQAEALDPLADVEV